MKPADSTGGRLFGRELNNAPAGPSTFGTIRPIAAKAPFNSLA
jgi:hypothetical protein